MIRDAQYEGVFSGTEQLLNLRLPLGYDASEVFEALDAAQVPYDLDRDPHAADPQITYQGQEFFGANGIRRMIRYRELDRVKL